MSLLEESAPGRLYDGRLLRRLLSYLRPYRGQVALACLCLAVHAAVEVAGPWLTKVAVDRYLAPVASGAENWLAPYLSLSPHIGLAQIGLLYFAALLAALLSSFGQSYFMTGAGQRALADIRHQTLAHLQRLDVAYYDRTPVGRMLTRVTTDADALSEMFTSGLVTVAGDVLMLSLVFVVMLTLSVKLTGILLLAVPLVVMLTVRFRRDVTASNRRVRTAVARINSYLQEHLSGMATLQLYNREGRSKQEFRVINEEHMTAYKDAILAYAWFYPLVEFCGMLTVALLLAYGGWQAREGGLSLGVLIAFFQYGLRFFRPVQDLSEKYNILQAAIVAAERIFHLLDTAPGITAPASQHPTVRPAGAVEFDRVWFAYKEGEWVLRDVSFRIEPGETIAVVGHTGAGKTTLTQLLLRFYDVQQGTICVDGVDIRQLPLSQLRERFAVVLQDPFLFTGTLRDNVRLGSPLSDAAVRAALEAVNLGPFVASLARGLDHPIRERGAGLSTGQKQLISFARALAHDPQFLILDEATSSVDTETEQRIREALHRLLEGRTSLIIAHRLSTVQRATRILVMHKGQLREAGSHQELLARRGLYWKLYRLQYESQQVGQSS